VVINEVSAGNSVFVNEYYKKNDWVELYNLTSEDIDLEGMYLSDDNKDPMKYRITDGGTETSTIIPANGYKVIWCDKLETISQLHASFKLATRTISMSSSRPPTAPGPTRSSIVPTRVARVWVASPTAAASCIACIAPQSMPPTA
jgi:hypothetical protein